MDAPGARLSDGTARLAIIALPLDMRAGCPRLGKPPSRVRSHKAIEDILPDPRTVPCMGRGEIGGRRKIQEI
jgi:hypothetical protein